MGRNNQFIITARKLVPVTNPDIDNGALVITDGKITGIGKRKSVLKKYPKVRAVELGDVLVMPGLVNLHSHLDLSHLKDRIGEKEHLVDWIFELVDLKRKSKKDEAVTAAREALRQVIRTGTTCIGDITGTGVSLPLLVESGIRAVCFYEVLGRDEETATKALKGFISFKNKATGLPDRVGIGISPHSAYSVSHLILNKIQAYKSSFTLPLTSHISETIDEHLYLSGRPSEMDRYMKRFGWDGPRPDEGKTPLAVMKGYGLSKNMIAAHCVHATAPDMRHMKAAGVSVAYCPRSNSMLKVGSAPVPSMLDRGVNVGIGTDSLASNIDLDLWEEMRFAYLTAGIKAASILEMATIAGARALGYDRVAGSIEPGKDADIIAIDTPASKMKDPARTLILNTGPEDIVFTMVQGRALYSRDGQTPYEI